jgi:uncharacterized protein YjbI with pentapeptide repeats
MRDAPRARTGREQNEAAASKTAPLALAHVGELLSATPREPIQSANGFIEANLRGASLVSVQFARANLSRANLPDCTRVRTGPPVCLGTRAELLENARACGASSIVRG